MPKLEKTNDNMFSKVVTGADYNRSLGVLKDVLVIISASQAASKVVATGFKYVKGSHELEVYVNGVLKRRYDTIDEVAVGDYLEQTNFSVLFDDDVIAEGDQVRFRVTAANYKISNSAGISGIDTELFAQMQSDLYQFSSQLQDIAQSLSDALVLSTELHQFGKDVFGDNYDYTSPRTIGNIPTGSATYDLSNYKTWLTANATSTTITNFTGCVADDERFVIIGDSNTIIQHNANIIVPGGYDLKLGLYDVLHLIFDGTRWLLVSRYGSKRVDTLVPAANWILSNDLYYYDIDISTINKQYNSVICIDDSDDKEFSPTEIVNTDSTSIRIWMPINTIDARIVVLG